MSEKKSKPATGPVVKTKSAKKPRVLDQPMMQVSLSPGESVLLNTLGVFPEPPQPVKLPPADHRRLIVRDWEVEIRKLERKRERCTRPATIGAIQKQIEGLRLKIDDLQRQIDGATSEESDNA